MTSPSIPSVLSESDYPTLKVLHRRVLNRIGISGVHNREQSEKDVQDVYLREDIDAMRALDFFYSYSTGTRAVLLVVEILRDGSDANVALLITEEMVEALIQVSTVMAITPDYTVENAHKVCAIVVRDASREDAVIDLIRNRRIFKAEDIEEVLTAMESGSSALSEGTL